jgi:hypothetical protein
MQCRRYLREAFWKAGVMGRRLMQAEQVGGEIVKMKAVVVMVELGDVLMCLKEVDGCLGPRMGARGEDARS